MSCWSGLGVIRLVFVSYLSFLLPLTYLVYYAHVFLCISSSCDTATLFSLDNDYSLHVWVLIEESTIPQCLCDC